MTLESPISSSSKNPTWFRRLSGSTASGPKLFRRRSEKAEKVVQEVEIPEAPKMVEVVKIPSAEPAKSPSPVLEKSEVAIFLEAERCYQASQNNQLSGPEWNKRLDETIAIIDSLLLRKPREPKFLLLRAKCLVDKRDRENRTRALSEFGLALAHCPMENLELRCRILMERGKTHVFLNQLDEAIRDYDEVLKLDENHHEVRIRKANIYIYSEKREYEKGIVELGFIINNLKEGELLIGALRSRSNAAMMSEDYQLAYDDYTRLSSFFPDDSNLECKRDQALTKLGSQPKIGGM
jgi:tetratricopeptide (TPR) repeat protein